MRFRKEEIQKIAILAKLKFSDDEIKKFTDQFNEIVEYFNKLNKINTDNIEPLSHPIEIFSNLREDQLNKSIDINDALLNAPDRDEQFFLVPKVIKEK